MENGDNFINKKVKFKTFYLNHNVNQILNNFKEYNN